MLTQRQEAELSQGGDCFMHYHSQDRQVTHDRLVSLQGIANVRTVVADYLATMQDDVLLVDTTAGNITVTLPPAAGGKEFILVKLAAANSLTVIPSGTDTVVGTTSKTITAAYDHLHWKAIPGGFVLI